MALPLLSQLAHVELTSPTPQASLEFWTQMVGLEETAREGQSVYLRGWGDGFHHTLQLTEGAQAGLGHVGWRAAGPEQLEQAVARLDAGGVGEGWFEDTVGHGRAFRYRAPGASEWQELDLEQAMDMIAGRVIAARENGWQETDRHGWRVDRTLAF